MADRFLNKAEAAKFLKISVRTLERLDGLPRVHIAARRVIFSTTDLVAYAKCRAATSTDAGAASKAATITPPHKTEQRNPKCP